jgi:hypothetical protein
MQAHQGVDALDFGKGRRDGVVRVRTIRRVNGDDDEGAEQWLTALDQFNAASR